MFASFRSEFPMCFCRPFLRVFYGLPLITPCRSPTCSEVQRMNHQKNNVLVFALGVRGWSTKLHSDTFVICTFTRSSKTHFPLGSWSSEANGIWEGFPFRRGMLPPMPMSGEEAHKENIQSFHLRKLTWLAGKSPSSIGNASSSWWMFPLSC